MSRKYPILRDGNWLYKQYVANNLSCAKISVIVGCGKVTILRALETQGIKRRNHSEANSFVTRYPILADRAWLYQKYVVENLSCLRIATLLKCSHETVTKALRVQGIKVRGIRGWNHTKETKQKLSVLRKKQLEDEEYAKRIQQALSARPTKPEKRCCEIFRKNGLPYKYVGDGGVVIGRKCPDFIHCTKKIVIEVFGKAFHSPLFAFVKLTYHRTYDGTMEHYKKHGYKCVIIWDRDLEREDAEAFVLLQLKKAGVI